MHMQQDSAVPYDPTQGGGGGHTSNVPGTPNRLDFSCLINWVAWGLGEWLGWLVVAGMG